MDLSAIITWSHVACGAVSLLSGFLALFSQKGKGLHLTFGNVFFFSMAGVFVSACILSLINQRTFLFFIGFFSFFLALNGRLSLSFMRKPKLARSFRWIYYFFLFFHVGMLIFGTLQGGSILILSSIFGGLGLAFSLQFLRDCKKQRSRTIWLKRHISGMIGGFIASISAFSVVTLTFLPGLVQWLWPTVLLTPIIIFWQRKISNSSRD